MNIFLARDAALAPMAWRPDDRLAISAMALAADAVTAAARTRAPDLLVLQFPPSALARIIRDVAEAQPDIMIVPIVADPSPELLLDLLRLGVADVLADVSELTVDRVAAIGTRHARGDHDEPKITHLQAFIAAKGGAGATTVIANYAHALAAKVGKPVLVVDLSLPWGDLDLYLSDDTDSHDLSAFLAEIDRIDKPLFRAMVAHLDGDVDFIPAPLDPALAPGLQAEPLLKLIATARQLYDWIIFDFGSSLNYLNLAVVDMLETLHVVVRPDVPGARRTGQLLKLLKDLEFDDHRVSIVVNSSGSKNSLPVESFEAAIGRVAEVRLPFAATESADSSARHRPIVSIAPKSAYARAILDWVGKAEASPRKDGSKWSIFGSILRK